jgi:CRP-like cAMP-binding protein
MTAIRRAAKTLEYQNGEHVFGPTAARPHVYLLVEGLVRIHRVSTRGEEFTVGYVRPGELFGEVSVIANQPSESFAQAVRPSKALRIPRETFLKVILSSNPVLYAVMKKIGQRLVRCQTRVEDLVFHDAPTRLARLLVRLGDEFGEWMDGGLALRLPLTQQEMAMLIGTTRQTVSAALGQLVRAGVVARDQRQLRVKDPRALRKFARLPATPDR